MVHPDHAAMLQAYDLALQLKTLAERADQAARDVEEHDADTESAPSGTEPEAGGADSISAEDRRRLASFIRIMTQFISTRMKPAA